MSSSHELVIQRLIDSPRDRIWQAWTNVSDLKQWWSPVIEADVQPGGTWRAEVMAPDGTGAWSHGTYITVDRPKEVSYTFEWDASETVPTTVTISLTEHGEQTEMTVLQTGFANAADRDDHKPGWNTTFDELEAFLAR